MNLVSHHKEKNFFIFKVSVYILYVSVLKLNDGDDATATLNYCNFVCAMKC